MAKLTYGSTISAIYDPQVGAPLDSRMAVATFGDLTKIETWKTNGGTSAQAYSYYGMLVYVGKDGDKNGLYTLQPSKLATEGKKTVTDDTQDENCWIRISQPDTKIQAIIDRVYTGESNISELNSAIEAKLAKDFGSYSAASVLTSETKVPAQINGANVYITGEQIKTFAALAVSDKGTFESKDALNAAFPNPEDGWTATVLTTGTTWIANGGVWTDSGIASGVTSINGKTGIVTLGANDVGAYTKSETKNFVYTYVGEIIEKTDWKSKLNYFNQSDGEALTSRVEANETAIANIKIITDNIAIAIVNEQIGTVGIPINAINFKVIFDFETENSPNRTISEVYGRNTTAVALSEVVVGSNSVVITSVSETEVAFDLGVVPTKAVITVTTL
jgi:hypothetical protein